MKKCWIGVDLDGTLARYEGWKGATAIGEPIPEMVARVKRWISKGWNVKVFTARVDGGDVAITSGDARSIQWKMAARDVEAIKTAIGDWCEKHIGQLLEVTNVKDLDMVCLFDDRCVSVEMNTGKILSPDVHGLNLI